MKHGYGKKPLVCLLSALAVCAQSNRSAAISDDNPYSAILSRNVFALHAPPPPPPPPEPPKPPVPKLTLTGIVTVYGPKRAYIKGNFAAKPGDPVKENYLTLQEGQREADIEVLHIDEIKKVVTVNNCGQTQEITFATPSAAGGIPGATPAAAAAGVLAPAAGGSVPLPRTIPTPVRPMRPTNPGGIVAPEATTATPAPAPIVATTVAPPAPAQPAPPPLTVEEQEVLIEANRMILKAAGDESHIIWPPTSMSEALQEEENNANAPAPAPAATPNRGPALPMPGRPGFPQPF